MQPVPQWLAAINWSAPILVERLRDERFRLPELSGVYLFTEYERAVELNTGNLYAGKATSLRKRVPSYLVSPDKIPMLAPSRSDGSLNSSLKHAGKALILMKVMQRTRQAGPSGIWVRWHTCANPSILEARLITTLQPAYNSHLL